jgi:hypothetical protein
VHASVGAVWLVGCRQLGERGTAGRGESADAAFAADFSGSGPSATEPDHSRPNEAIHQARQIPGVGRFVPPYTEFLTLLPFRRGGGKARPAAAESEARAETNCTDGAGRNAHAPTVDASTSADSNSLRTKARYLEAVRTWPKRTRLKSWSAAKHNTKWTPCSARATPRPGPATLGTCPRILLPAPQPSSIE